MATKSPSESSLSMKMVIQSMKSKFPKVENISTETVYSWTAATHSGKSPDGGSAAQSSSGSSLPDGSLQTTDKRRLLLLDTRPDFEYDVSHIPNAIRVSPDAEASDVQKTVSSLKEYQGEQTVVCYCSLGYRSSKYADILSKELEKENPDVKKSVNIYNLEGSIFKWANERKPMVDHKNNPTIYAHPYNFLFGKILSKELRKSHAGP